MAMAPVGEGAALQVPWREAAQELREMFPATQASVVEGVLEAHGGHLEHAVESLLSLQAGGSGAGGSGQGASSESSEGPGGAPGARAGGARGAAGAPGLAAAARAEQLEQDEALARRLQAQEAGREEDPHRARASRGAYWGDSGGAGYLLRDERREEVEDEEDAWTWLGNAVSSVAVRGGWPRSASPLPRLARAC